MAQQGATMTLPDNTIWHLVQSGNAIKIGGKLLIFDYPEAADKRPAGAGLDGGYIDPDQIRDEQVLVFASHSHGDHFHPDIFGWKETVSDIRYVVAYDVTAPPRGVRVVRPNQILDIGGCRVKTYTSTDSGVAYSVHTGGRHVYFAGDNAFWNWDGDLTDDIYIRLTLSEIDVSRPIDIAFQVCDPRLEGIGSGGIYIFARHFSPKLLVPIHAFGDYGFNRRVAEKLDRQGFEGKFWCVGGRGDRMRIE
jgi:L-ascorbate metabolism protein UlaG (beta-lactamase superfamily)